MTRMQQDIFSRIEKEYQGISQKIDILQKNLSYLFLQELKISLDSQGNIQDIILLLGDIEGLSYKSYKNMIGVLHVYEHLFAFPGRKTLHALLSTMFAAVQSPEGIDQYIGVSLLTHSIVEYYGIIGGIRPEERVVNVNFYPEYISWLAPIFPFVKKIEEGLPGNFYFSFDAKGNLQEKRLYFYEIHPHTFFHILQQNQGLSDSDTSIDAYAKQFGKISSDDCWKEYVCWKGYNDDTLQNTSHIMEFFLKSNKRKTLLDELDIYIGEQAFLEAYIYEMTPMLQTSTLWFLVQKSYLQRKNHGYYAH